MRFDPSTHRQLVMTKSSVRNQEPLLRRQTQGVQSKTFDETNGWKEEVDIDSILGSKRVSEFEKIIEDYHNIQDSGMKFPVTNSSMSFNSERRKHQFKMHQDQHPAEWAQDKYIKAVYRLQKAYLRND